MGYFGATLTQVFTRVRACRRSGHVTQRCHNSPGWETGLASANDVTRRKLAEDFVRYWKSQWVELRLDTGREGFTFVYSRDPWAGDARDSRGDEKARRERLCLSLLKGNKKFRTWTEKSLRVFRISRFLCSMYMYIYEHYMSISHIHIRLWYIFPHDHLEFAEERMKLN